MILDLAITLVKILFIVGVTVGFFAPVLTWVERKQSAIMQDRVGANRADIMGFTALGLFHAIADALKMFTKEDFIPQGANRFLHTLSPIVAVIPAILTFAVIPFGGQYDLWGESVNLVISDLDVGLLFVFAIASLATYGYVIAGWASNNNWSLLGSMRTASQMISYEVTMGLTIIGVLMVYGTMKLTDIGAAQEDFLNWGFFLQPLGFFMFLAASIAENKRIPFDAPEAESELVAGYFTEYSGLKFGMFLMAEFIEMVTIGAIVTILFFGAWHIPFLPTATLLSWFDFLGTSGANLAVMLINVAVFFAKVVFFIWFQMTIRWTLPRFRYDQIMKLGWKILLPLSLANILVTGLVILAVQ
ncbi:MAG TPA: NADH-quinone oxidoreductase subunit NuoH [Nitrospinaceae bacterium]|jgi:NADH-quinone oxidoreductase subunit H|nr:NADH-quinone oxidoreductase subunit NuoH [Nitrospinaceae bacterium]MDP7147664.1 NADH-quinone oxidoreductase subunit NuoH [Nitrospinaceae bacterium]HAX46534.1 NADH-quinone oxidoreductase subunit NuoH [Nitrospina sp.]HJO58111.1 NADH-quinone oxidoreductase subunit NuoH [Nitrospinaceae bacterium]|tara:strand:- start:2895 stop:3971 length:1077 start_codon:yes stop_codon:yes gene_type:complete